MYNVDIPGYPVVYEMTWKNVGKFNSKEEAILFIREYIGICDDNGNVCLLSQGDFDEEIS